jgi:predicted amidohydrolase YtcJ
MGDKTLKDIQKSIKDKQASWIAGDNPIFNRSIDDKRKLVNSKMKDSLKETHSSEEQRDSETNSG